jgi:hypothetical protein
LFHPDNFTFGQSLFTSQIYSAVAGISGVDSVSITRFCRVRSKDPENETVANLGQGYLEVGPDEVIRLDNDRNFPSNGLSIQVSER